jgi:hypothetical protein
MRSPEAASVMRALWSPPERHDDVFPLTVIEQLRDMQNCGHKAHKPGGVVDTDGAVAAHHPDIIDAVHRLVGAQAIIHQATFFATGRPFPIHADTLRDCDARPWKVFLIPLGCEPDMPTHTVTFAQRWLGLSANFTKGSPGFPSAIHDTVTDYADVIGASDRPFPQDFRERHLQHINPEMLEGLSVDRMLQWRVGSALVFDCGQLHTSDDFRVTGVQVKRGLTIITTHP